MRRCRRRLGGYVARSVIQGFDFRYRGADCHLPVEVAHNQNRTARVHRLIPSAVENEGRREASLVIRLVVHVRVEDGERRPTRRLEVRDGADAVGPCALVLGRLEGGVAADGSDGKTKSEWSCRTYEVQK